jgi:hypothetical protein
VGVVISRRTVIGGSLVLAGTAIVPARAAPRAKMWTFDDFRSIGGREAIVLGTPAFTESPWGVATVFDGVRDGILIDEHPLAGAATFTAEALIRPDGGAFEQRWLHLESDQTPPTDPGKSDTGLLFEIRVVDRRWYLDTFVTGAGYRQTLVQPAKTFPLNQWAHVAQSFDGRTYRSFVNGELQMAAVVPYAPQGPGRASVGVRLNRVNFFHGAIRQACFSPTALAPSRFRLPIGK